MIRTALQYSLPRGAQHGGRGVAHARARKLTTAQQQRGRNQQLPSPASRKSCFTVSLHVKCRDAPRHKPAKKEANRLKYHRLNWQSPTHEQVSAALPES
jgi:hypothetical protein